MEALSFVHGTVTTQARPLSFRVFRLSDYLPRHECHGMLAFGPNPYGENSGHLWPFMAFPAEGRIAVAFMPRNGAALQQSCEPE